MFDGVDSILRTMDVAVIILLLGALAACISLYVRASREAKERQQTALRLEEKSAALEQSLIEQARLEQRLASEREVAAEKLKTLNEAEVRMKVEFENLANRIFEDKGRALTEQNREKITGVLEPFKTQLESFRKRVDEIHANEAQRTGQLIEQVRHLQEMSNKVSAEANHLASAIKGDTKIQGGWGELIVARIFEASGLQSGREYEEQKSFNDEEGRKRPDFIVHLPGQRALIVDAKVSLTAYERYARADDEAQQRAAMAEHVKSIRQHIKELKVRNYENLLGNRTLDFVIMCVPLEPAYQAALQADPELLYDLAGTNVVLAGPATLMVTLKLIVQIWRRENENRNAEQIAAQAGRMYDQIVLVHEAMADAQKKLGGVSDSIETAMKRLKDGKGSLAGRAEEMRSLGAKVKKQLPTELLDSEAV